MQKINQIHYIKIKISRNSKKTFEYPIIKLITNEIALYFKRYRVCLFTHLRRYQFPYFFFPSFHNETRENYLIKNSNTKLDRARQLDGIHIREDWFTTTVRCSGGSRSGSSLDHSATAAFV